MRRDTNCQKNLCRKWREPRRNGFEPRKMRNKRMSAVATRRGRDWQAGNFELDSLCPRGCGRIQLKMNSSKLKIGGGDGRIAAEVRAVETGRGGSRFDLSQSKSKQVKPF